MQINDRTLITLAVAVGGVVIVAFLAPLFLIGLGVGSLIGYVYRPTIEPRVGHVFKTKSKKRIEELEQKIKDLQSTLEELSKRGEKA